jgi:two-component system, sensor histidine kinase and response regulator
MANILLVDDKVENLLTLSAVLEPLGENLVLANSGEEALRQLLDQEFALILMDAVMPGLDGFQTAEIIRSRPRTSNIPIIFVTARGMVKGDMFRSYSVGAVDYIPKPFDADILRSKAAVFVDLYRKNEQIKQQADLIHQSQLREVERKQQELQETLEREHMRALNEELERRVHERTAELLEANAEMEAFCYSVSHDLRTPLRAISSTSRILLEDVGERLTEEEVAHLRRQAAAASRLGSLIDDLLELSRVGRSPVQRNTIDVSKLVRSIIVERAWPDNVKVEIQPKLRAAGDAGLIRVVFDNLLDNAAKYSPKGGTVQIGACHKEGHVIFFVRDQGIGFDMAYVDKIFKPFERLTADDVYEGTGIGLAIVHRIVSRHSGRVWAESTLGEGSCFYFTLAKETSEPGCEDDCAAKPSLRR